MRTECGGELRHEEWQGLFWKNRPITIGLLEKLEKQTHIPIIVKIEGELIVSDRERVKPYHMLISK